MFSPDGDAHDARSSAAANRPVGLGSGGGVAVAWRRPAGGAALFPGEQGLAGAVTLFPGEQRERSGQRILLLTRGAMVTSRRARKEERS